MSNKTYRRIAGSWLRGQAYVFSRNKEQYRLNWRAGEFDPIGGVLIDTKWFIEKRTHRGWNLIHIESTGDLNRAAECAAEHIDLI